MSDRCNATADRDCAALCIRMLLNGGLPNGAPPEAFGEWRDIIEILMLTYSSEGTSGVRRAWHECLKRRPELAELVSGDYTEAERKSHWAAKELLTAEFPPIQWVVPGIFPEGLTFLAGRPKIGKSLLALQLAHAVSSGGNIFNQ